MDKERAFIEEFALYFEQAGWMRMDGRILAWLFICEPPHQSFSELVAILQASKSSISTSSRQLIRAGWIERIRFAGKRGDYYRLRPEFCNSSITYFVAKMEALQKITEKGLALLQGAPSERLARLAEAHDIFLFMQQEMPKLLKT
ncbi:MAG: MarR family transcriptional regulator, partial [Pseudomonadota bacterium]